jgi:hypothetical protein
MAGGGPVQPVLAVAQYAAAQMGISVPVSSGGQVGGSAGVVHVNANSAVRYPKHAKSLPAPTKWGAVASEQRKPATFLSDAKEWLQQNGWEPAQQFQLVSNGAFREHRQVIRVSYQAKGTVMSWSDVEREFMILNLQSVDSGLWILAA